MSTPLITVTTAMTIVECAVVMKDRRIHHLPVADDNGTVVGMISANDFLIVAEQLGHGNSERTLH
jgi:CBS domain-containing protein